MKILQKVKNFEYMMGFEPPAVQTSLTLTPLSHPDLITFVAAFLKLNSSYDLRADSYFLLLKPRFLASKQENKIVPNVFENKDTNYRIF